MYITYCWAFFNPGVLFAFPLNLERHERKTNHGSVFSIILSMFQSKQGLQKRSSRLRRIHSGTRSWCSITMITVTDLFSLLLLYIYKISKKPFKIQGLGSGQAVMVKTEQNTVVLQVRCNSTQKIEERNYELKSKIKTSH